MNFINLSFKWVGVLSPRTKTKHIVLHHRGGNGDVMSIHQDHISDKGWLGIGYHFYIRKDGRIYSGRPIDTIGAHSVGANNISIGVCFEGNFEKEDMNDTQIKAGQRLISYLRGLYPDVSIKKHNDFEQTACPGKNFPFNRIKEGERNMTVEEAIRIIKEKAGLEAETMTFLNCYKYSEALLIKLAKAMV